MKFTKYISIVLVTTLFTLTGCTENVRSRTFGGTMKVEIPDGNKFVNATWKEGNLWVLTKEVSEGEPRETYTFVEKSSFGMIEGKVIFVEK
jgi:hypothetical protein